MGKITRVVYPLFTIPYKGINHTLDRVRPSGSASNGGHNNVAAGVITAGIYGILGYIAYNAITSQGPTLPKYYGTNQFTHFYDDQENMIGSVNEGSCILRQSVPTGSDNQFFDVTITTVSGEAMSGKVGISKVGPLINQEEITTCVAGFEPLAYTAYKVTQDTSIYSDPTTIKHDHMVLKSGSCIIADANSDITTNDKRRIVAEFDIKEWEKYYSVSAEFDPTVVRPYYVSVSDMAVQENYNWETPCLATFGEGQIPEPAIIATPQPTLPPAPPEPIVPAVHEQFLLMASETILRAEPNTYSAQKGRFAEGSCVTVMETAKANFLKVSAIVADTGPAVEGYIQNRHLERSDEAAGITCEADFTPR